MKRTNRTETINLIDENNKDFKREQKRTETFKERIGEANLFLSDGIVFLKPSQIGRETQTATTEKDISINGYNVVISERVKEEKIKHNPNMDLSLYKTILSDIDGETATLYKQYLLNKGKRESKRELKE